MARKLRFYPDGEHSSGSRMPRPRAQVSLKGHLCPHTEVRLSVRTHVLKTRGPTGALRGGSGLIFALILLRTCFIKAYSESVNFRNCFKPYKLYRDYCSVSNTSPLSLSCPRKGFLLEAVAVNTLLSLSLCWVCAPIAVGLVCACGLSSVGCPLGNTASLSRPRTPKCLAMELVLSADQRLASCGG